MADPAGTVYKLALEATYATARDIVTPIWFVAADGAHTLDDLYNDWQANILASWQAANVQHTVLGTVSISTFTIETPSVPAVVIKTAGLPAAGTQLDNVGGAVRTPAMCAQHAVLRTPLAGRSNRGRFYLGPAALFAGSGDTTDGFLWPNYSTTRHQAFLNAMLSRYPGIGPATWRWIVWSRRRGGNSHVTSGGRTVYVNKPPFHAAGVTAITSATAYAGIRTQRRREAPRGV